MALTNTACHFPSIFREAFSHLTLFPVLRSALMAYLLLCHQSTLADEATKSLVQHHNDLRRAPDVTADVACALPEQNHPLPMLTQNALLTELAVAQAERIKRNDSLSHGKPLKARLERVFANSTQSFTYAAENLAQSPADVKRVMSLWVSSTPHCRAIFDARFNQIGAAKSGNYWVVILAQITN